MTEIKKKMSRRKGPFRSFMQVLREDAVHFAMNKKYIFISMILIFSIHDLFMPTILDLLL